MNKTLQVILLITASIFFLNDSIAQKGPKHIFDNYNPELNGPVKSYALYTIINGDTMVEGLVKYTRSGYKESEYTKSRLKKMGVQDDSTCWRQAADTIFAYDCNSNKYKKAYLHLNKDGTISTENFPGRDEEQQRVFYYDAEKRLTGIYLARIKDNVYQFIATRLYTYNKKGQIIKVSASGSEQIQGLTIYSYDKKGNLIQTENKASEKDEKGYVITYSNHDKHGNWTKFQTQEGMIMIREIVYY